MTERNLYSMFPVVHNKLWDFYKRQSQAFWLPEEIDLSQDVAEFESLPSAKQHFITHVLAFFNQSDGIVNENLVLRFYNDVKIPEARAVYARQIAVEAIHAETYSLLLETYVKDEEKKNQLFDAITHIPAVKRKADWAFKWIDSQEDFAARLFAFAVIEGVFFSGSFCAIFWLKSQGLLPGLGKSNEFISRDEGLHWTFAAELFKTMGLHLSPSQVLAIIKDAVEIETAFVCDALPVDMIGMNAKLMSQYVQYTADRVLQHFNLSPVYNVDNPFAFMNLIDMESKTNFFEGRVSEYKKGGDRLLSFDEAF